MTDANVTGLDVLITLGGLLAGGLIGMCIVLLVDYMSERLSDRADRRRRMEALSGKDARLVNLERAVSEGFANLDKAARNYRVAQEQYDRAVMDLKAEQRRG